MTLMTNKCSLQLLEGPPNDFDLEDEPGKSSFYLMRSFKDEEIVIEVSLEAEALVRGMCVCVCVCARACVRACVHACVRACVCLQMCVSMPVYTRSSLATFMRLSLLSTFAIERGLAKVG